MAKGFATRKARMGRSVAAAVVAVGLAAGATPAHAASTPPGQPIVGGNTVSAGWPWAVFIYNQDTDGACTGVLIAAKTVATAAHCVNGTAPSDLFVTNDRVVDFGTSPFVGATAVSVIPGFSEMDPFSPDLAKITLASGLTASAPVTVINRLSTGEVTGSAKALAGGYGLTGPSNPEDDTLREAVFTNLAAGSGGCGSSRWVCANTGPPSTCFGDSGGPLVVQLGADTVTASPSPSNGAWRLAGLTQSGDVNCSHLSNFSSLLNRDQHDFLQPDTTITSGPSGNTTDRTPTFSFTSHPSGATFQCSVDGAVFKACLSPRTTPVLAFGNHAFQVRAKSDGVVDASPAKRSFKVVRP